MAVSDFLDNLSNPQTITGIASAVLGARSANSQNQNLQNAYGPNPYDAQYEQLSQQLMQLTGQAANPNDPAFQARVKAREDEIMRLYEQTLRQQQAVEARRYGRTGMGMVNPERRDEAIARSLASFRSQAQAQARAEAMGEVVNAAKVGQGSAPVVARGSDNTVLRRTAGANAQNQTDVGKQNAYLALAGQVLGPLLKGVDFKKMIEGVAGPSSGGVASSPTQGGAPSFDASTMYGGGGGDFSNIDWGASQGGGVPMPQIGGNVPSWSDPSFDIGGWNDYMSQYNQPNLELSDFSGFESAALPSTDPAGYNFDFTSSAPQFDSTSFSPSFDFNPVQGFDVGGWDFGAGGW